MKHEIGLGKGKGNGHVSYKLCCLGCQMNLGEVISSTLQCSTSIIGVHAVQGCVCSCYDVELALLLRAGPEAWAHAAGVAARGVCRGLEAWRHRSAVDRVQGELLPSKTPLLAKRVCAKSL